RAKFLEDFWKRRDPTPGTERNEYKEAYFNRIEEANRLFKGGGRAGWLQDRGRIYILFGPPDERQTNPMGGRPIDAYADPTQMVEGRRYASGEKPTEVWVYYNLFSSLQRPHTVRIVFVDTYGTGDYKLATNIEEVIPGRIGAENLFGPNLAFTHELNKEEAARQRLHLQRALFDFSWEFLKKKNKELGSNLTLHLMLPYNKMLFIKRDQRLTAILNLEIQIKDTSDKIVWQYGNEYKVDLREELIKENKQGAWEINIPVTKWLDKGSYSVYLKLTNSSADQKVEKLLPLKM
ncbi:MAG: GWxTD domain-containing protein, partial [Candidatus Aminicenantales bacterium]